MSEEHDSLDEMVARFVHGARTLHVGYYLDIRAVERKGLKIIGIAARQIDATSPEGRDLLLPLLDHDEEGVRVVAAAALYQSHTERAIAVLQHVDRFGITEASGLAMKILMFHGRLNPCPSDPRYVGLYEDENGVDHLGDQAFRLRAYRGQLPNQFARKAEGAVRAAQPPNGQE